MLIRCHINCMSHSQAGEEPGNKTMHTYLLLLCLKAKLIMQKYQYTALPPITEHTSIQIRNWCLPTSLRWSIWTKLAIVSANSSCVWRLRRLLSTRTHWVNTHLSIPEQEACPNATCSHTAPSKAWAIQPHQMLYRAGSFKFKLKHQTKRTPSHHSVAPIGRPSTSWGSSLPYYEFRDRYWPAGEQSAPQVSA